MLIWYEKKKNIVRFTWRKIELFVIFAYKNLFYLKKREIEKRIYLFK